MKYKITLIFLFIGLNSIAQIKFEKGYYINNDGIKVNCLIKNLDWLNNPTYFTYKKNETSKEVKKTIKNVKEFGVNNTFKFQRYKVNIDKSSLNTDDLSQSRFYNYTEEILFLKLLVEGNANLYIYKKGNLEKYFYKNKDHKVLQLEYKEYLNSKSYIVKNKNYLTQLRVNLPCPQLNIKKVSYRKNSLVNYFLAFNNCGNNKIIKNYTKKNTSNKFNLNFKLGIGYSKIIPFNPFFTKKNAESNGTNIRVGVEGEYILPFNKNKWSLFLEPTFQTFNSNIKGSLSGEIKYSSIELPIGVKHYLFLNKKSKLFLSSAYVLDFVMDSNININTLGNLEVITSPSIQIGLGYNYKNKYIIEFRYNYDKDLTLDYAYWETKYSSLSFVLGYHLF